MKTKILLLLCLFIGIMVLPTKAQDKANNASQTWYESAYTASGVWCDGEMIDRLEGEVRIHYVVRTFKNGSLLQNIQQCNGELTSEATGEVFRFSRVIKWEFTGVWTGIGHYNLKGNMGSMYSGKIYYDYSSGSPVFTELHAVCH